MSESSELQAATDDSSILFSDKERNAFESRLNIWKMSSYLTVNTVRTVKTNRLMLFREIIDVCYDSQAKHV